MLNKLIVLILAAISVALLVPGARAQNCKVAVATAGSQSETVERFQRAMEQSLLSVGITPVRVMPDEVADLIRLGGLSSERVKELQKLGACKIVFVRIEQTGEKRVTKDESKTIPLLALFLGLVVKKDLPPELMVVLGVAHAYLNKHKSVRAIKFEATAELHALPRTVLFSDTQVGTALVSKDGSALITVGSNTREISWSERSEIDTATLRAIAQELLQKMRGKL